MKVSHLLTRTQQLVHEHNFAVPPTPSYPTNLTQKLVSMEELLSWRALAKLLKNTDVEISEAAIQPFINFLTERWSRIKDIYQLTYTQTYNNPLTLACVSLARELAAIDKSCHYLQLLMPTIYINNESLLMNIIQLDEMAEETSVNTRIQSARKILEIYDDYPLPPKALYVAQMEGLAAAEKEKIQLHHFILDQWGYIINIQDCIAYAMEDGILKHTSALETHVNEYGQVPGYELRVMPKRFNERKQKTAKRNCIYIRAQKASFIFFMAGMEKFGVITAAELHITNLPLTMGKLIPFQVEILEILSIRGHIIIPKRPRRLLAQEKIRILHHSLGASASYQALTNVVREKNKAYNARQAIDNLARFLREGGVHGHRGGIDEMSGLSSYIGIRQFYDFTQSITPKNLKSLMEACVIYSSNRGLSSVTTIRMIWSELLATALDRDECYFSEQEKENIIELIEPYFDAVIVENEKIKEINASLPEEEKRKVTRPILCSEQFSSKLSEINASNKHLSEIIPINYTGNKDDDKKRKTDIEFMRAASVAGLRTAILNNELKHYSATEVAEFPIEVQAALEDKISLVKFVESLQPLINSVDTFIYLLVGIPREYHNDLFSKFLAADFLQEFLLNTPEKIVAFFTTIALHPRLDLQHTATLIMSKLNQDFLQKIVATKYLIHQLKLILPSEVYRQFLLTKPGSPQNLSLGFLSAPKSPLQSAQSEQVAENMARKSLRAG